jgi:hypothetical protein
MELKATNHSYYCEDSNFYKSGTLIVYDKWNDFKENWLQEDLTIDNDYNHCFRFDIEQEMDDEDEPIDEFSLKLYIMHQRKGQFAPITIKKITEEDMPEIEKYLSNCWNYLKNQWTEFDK